MATMRMIGNDGQTTVCRRPMTDHKYDSRCYHESNEISEIAEVVESELLQLLDLLTKEPEIFLIY
jgi:hypothetical protein